MISFIKRLTAMTRRLLRPTRFQAEGRRAMTFAEALVMIVVAGSLMIPVVGTLQTGVDRTTAYVHQDRMRTIAQASMTEILAGSAYARTPVVDFIATVSWPINDPETIATYIMEVETLEGITLATLTSTVTGDFAGNEALLGSQPANLKTIVITVTHVPDPGDTDVEPAQVRLFSMVATPRSFNPNRIYIADKDNICVYAIDPLTKNVVETFDLPFSTTPKTKTANNPFRPGNIAVHPNGDWVLTQREASLLLTDVGLFSPTRRTSVQVYATTTVFLENANDNEAIRKDRGVAFRPDGRYCYVTSHAPSGLSILSVPDGIVASFSLVKFLPISTAKFVDLQVGEDGYIYIGDYDYTSKSFRRLNMFAPQGLVALEDYNLPGWLTTPNKKAMAACTSRDGRRVYSVWEGAFIASSSSDNPADWGCAEINYSTNPGGEDIQDVQVSGDNKVVIATSKQGGGKTRIFAMPTELKGSTITTWSDPPNRVAYPGSGDITNQAILSPAMNEIWVDRKAAGEIYALDTPGLLAGSFTTAIPADRTVIFLPSGDAGCVAARMSEMVAVACDGPVKTIEFIDPWSKHHYENLTRKLPYANTPSHLAYNGAGDRLSVCYGVSTTLPTEIDVFNGGIAPTAIDPVNWGATVDRKPTHHVYYQNGGFLIQKYGSTVGANGYVSFDNAGVKQADEDFPLTTTMSDVIPLNDGGALVLVTDFIEGWTRLDRIGPDARVWVKWDSRFDNFPSHGATQMAVSADDGILALYTPNSDSPGVGQLWQFYDMRTNNFGPLTQQKGFITDFRLSERSFAGGVPSAQKMTGTTFKLRDTFTCNDAVPNMASYPANFAYTAANKYAGNAGETRSSRFFGYLRIPTAVQTMGLWNRDASQVFLGTEPMPLLGTILDAYTSGKSATSPVSLTDAASRWIQLDHTSDNPQSDMALFYSKFTGANSTTVTQDYSVSGITEMGPNTADWKRLPAEYTNPLRFTPQYLYSLRNHQSYPTTDLPVSMCFSRDIASPTFYMFNIPFGKFGVKPFDKSNFIPSFSLTAFSVKGMTITPDGQRLLLAATNPNKVHIIDISTPATSTYMTEVGSIDLPQPPACIVARPFNRINSRKNTYEVVATLAGGIGGSDMATLASGGIYLFGATPAILSTPTKKTLCFNPMLNVITDKGDKLLKAVRNHSVFSYDGDVYAMNGHDGATTTSWIQRWSPATDELRVSADLVSSLVPTWIDLPVHPVMTTNNNPTPYDTAWSSAYYSDRLGWTLFDGNQSHNTGMGHWTAGGNSNEWVTIDLGDAKAVDKIIVYNWADGGSWGVKNFKLQGSHTNTWTALNSNYWDLVTNTATLSGGAQQFTLTSPGSYRYYRFFATTNYGGSTTVVAELSLTRRVRKVSPVMTSPSAPSPYSVTAETEVSGSGWKIFDGNTSTWWETSGSTNAWVRIDLGKPDIIDAVRVMGKSDALAETTKNFRIEGSQDDLAWANLSGSLIKPSNGDWDLFSFSNTVAYRYYRFVNESVQSGSQIKCPEVEFYSTQNPPLGVCLSNLVADDGATFIKRFLKSGAMTPYGYVSGGGQETGVAGGDRKACQVYWPHAVANYSGYMNYLSGISRDLPDLPFACHGQSLVYHKGYLYCIGGAAWNGTYVGGVQRFDFNTNSWTSLTPAADGDSLTDPDSLTYRYLHATCSFGDEIFIFGGATVAGACFTNTPVAWNPDTKVVRKLAPIPKTSVGASEAEMAPALRTIGMTAIPCGPAIYLFGGGSSWSGGGSGEVLKYTP